MLILPPFCTSSIMTGVLRGPDGVFENAPPSSLLIDCSTIDPGTSTLLNSEAVAAGHRMIDAPVRIGTMSLPVSLTYINFYM